MRKQLLSAIFTVAAVTLFSATAAAQFVLQPNEAASKDAKVYEYAVTPEGLGAGVPANYQSNLGVIGSISTPHSFKSLLQFDLSTMPIPAGQISLATVQLYCSSVAAGGDVSFYPVTSGWTETGVKWDTFPTHNPVAVDTETVSVAGQWYTFDITSLVQSWVSGTTPNNGIAIIMDTPTGSLVFLDSDGLGNPNPNPGLAPILTVVPEPSTAMLGVLGFAACAIRRRRS